MKKFEMIHIGTIWDDFQQFRTEQIKEGTSFPKKCENSNLWIWNYYFYTLYWPI